MSDSTLRLAFDENAFRAIQAWLAVLADDDVLKTALINLHPAYRTLDLDFDPRKIAPRVLQDRIAELEPKAQTTAAAPRDSRAVIEIPVHYDPSPDLDFLASHSGLTREDVIRKHTAPIYDVAFLGFAPGFPYLLGLDPQLQAPRLASPRLRVPAGSVAIGGGQTGIYPAETPGGWRLIGRTSLTLFDPHREPQSLLRPGDRLRFREVKGVFVEPAPQDMERARPLRPVVEVLSAGLYSSLQGAGHPRLAHLGVSPGGAADAVALALGNRLVGNPESAIAIEMTMIGGSFRFLEDAWIAFAGADIAPQIDGQSIAMWTSYPVRAGQRVITGSASETARTYLCVNGGWAGASAPGETSRPLRDGDSLARDRQTGAAGYRRVSGVVRRYYRELSEIRVTRGPQWELFDAESRRRIFAEAFEVSSESDRRGLRLKGPNLSHEASELVTEGVSAGAIQVSHNGQGMVLYCEQQTTGGYPKIANVIAADLFLIGQLRPGASVRFHECSLEEAWLALDERDRELKVAVVPF